ncbi:ATP-binding protein [Robbsia sp. Bb-Pol-6]|uniref:ATP-binding protein n=1 Tax=Robbsia betulipollinis TaxID=2981849 RepID=A0ABT3ZGR2_9BURK|nr:AAA family ATPase [Robbsia betulipollinis]MCY0385708.1 ATP-binding protein [Robbsia betulipollinis]
MPAFPFTALVAQARLQLALQLVAVDPGIGGVLISGPRGTAKSTSARALADLLPEGRFVNVPLGASEAQLIGTLDLEAVLREASVRFAPGLLARAHGGVLYVDEVNLLADHLVDPLLDVASSGINTVEREGVSHRHAARFVLVGTMNPEEGALRPQLSDRFGLAVALENCTDPLLRQQIVRTRLAYDADAAGFCAAHADAQRALAERLARARRGLARLGFDDTVHAHVSRLCIAAGVDGMRADLVMLKAARALAVFEEADAVTPAHVDRVAEFVLWHRRGASAVEAGTDDGTGNMTEGGTEGGTESGAGATDRGTSDDTDDTHDVDIAGGGGAGDVPSRGVADDDDGKDWGYVAPTPVRGARVKQTRPLPAKKA